MSSADATRGITDSSPPPSRWLLLGSLLSECAVLAGLAFLLWLGTPDKFSETRASIGFENALKLTGLTSLGWLATPVINPAVWSDGGLMPRGACSQWEWPSCSSGC